MVETKKFITLVSCDDESFEIEESAANLSRTISNLIEEGVDVDKGIPIPIVHSSALAKVVEYCNKHAEETNKKDNEAMEGRAFADWEKEFLGTDFDDLFAILKAASYLDIRSLMDCTAQTIADLIIDKSVEEIREIFDVENDYTAEEEAELRRENAWAFE